jgi:hypothetical protein
MLQCCSVRLLFGEVVGDEGGSDDVFAPPQVTRHFPALERPGSLISPHAGTVTPGPGIPAENGISFKIHYFEDIVYIFYY